MNSEEERIKTFASWPVNAPVYPLVLAQNGFYATGNFLEASCHWCNCCISDWEYGDDVQQRHLAVSPHCEFVRDSANCGNIRTQEFPHTTSDVDNASAQMTSDTQQSSDLMIEANRLATFRNWPVLKKYTYIYTKLMNISFRFVEPKHFSSVFGESWIFLPESIRSSYVRLV